MASHLPGWIRTDNDFFIYFFMFIINCAEEG